jgi:hypothetical protein
MSLEDFRTSDTGDRDSDQTAESEFKNCRTEVLSNTEDLETPDFVSPWVSEDGLTAMMEVSPDYFRDHVSEEVKERAKKKGLIFLDAMPADPVIVLTDDPEEYGELLETFGLEDYLHKRVKEVI